MARRAARAQDAYRDKPDRCCASTLRRNVDLRKLVDLYNPQRPGFFTAFIDGKRFNKLVFQYDPLGIPTRFSGGSPALELRSSLTEGCGRRSIAPTSMRKGTASSDEDHRIFDITPSRNRYRNPRHASCTSTDT